jgi:hypothetical protein
MVVLHHPVVNFSYFGHYDFKSVGGLSYYLQMEVHIGLGKVR